MALLRQILESVGISVFPAHMLGMYLSLLNPSVSTAALAIIAMPLGMVVSLIPPHRSKTIPSMFLPQNKHIMNRLIAVGVASFAANGLALLVATSVHAQSAPPPLPISQSEPAFGRMSSEHSALVNQQAALARHKRDHNSMCLNIDPANSNRIQWCHTDNETIKQEIASYNQRLKIYKARVAEAQGQTLFLRKDYSGAISQFELAWSMMGNSAQPVFDGNILDEIQLAKAHEAEKTGDLELASTYFCAIEARKNAQPGWFKSHYSTLLGRIKARLQKKLTPRRGGGTCSVRG